MRFSLIPFLLVVIPIAEISAFVVIGSRIGLAATLGLVLVTAVIGSILLRWQGFGILNRINRDMEAGRVPARELVHGVMILVAGVLLLTPGFVTDTMGFLLFVPAVREAAWRFLRSRITVLASRGAFASGFSTGGPERGRSRGARVVDLEEGEFSREADGSSPWSGRPSGTDRDLTGPKGGRDDRTAGRQDDL